MVPFELTTVFVPLNPPKKDSMSEKKGKKVKTRDLLRKLEQILFAIEARNRNDQEMIKKWLNAQSPPSQASAPRDSPEPRKDLRDSSEARDKPENVTRKEDLVGCRARPFSCSGCEDLTCVLAWKHLGHLPADPQQWLVDHGLIRRPECPVHGESGKMRLEGNSYVCTHRVPGKGGHDNACRRKVHACWWRNCERC